MKLFRYQAARLGWCTSMARMLGRALALALLGAGAAMAAQPADVPPAKSVVVENFPAVQITETASQPFVMTGLAVFETGQFLSSVGAFDVPPGLALILDGASADLQGATTNADLMAQLRLHVLYPGEVSSVSVATDLKPVTIDLQGGGFIGNPVSWALPPMHLPPGTHVSVQVVQNSKTTSLDYRAVVTGHLVLAVPDE